MAGSSVLGLKPYVLTVKTGEVCIAPFISIVKLCEIALDGFFVA